MTQPPDHPVLDYQTQPLKYVEDAQDWKWRRRRLLLRAAIIVLFLPLAFYFGPNFFVLGRFTRPNTADLVAYTQANVVPIIQGIKQFQRDTGHMPQDIKEYNTFTQKYLPPSVRMNGNLTDQMYWHDGPYFEGITYSFTPGAEGFTVKGPFVNGPLPLQPVNLPVSRQPSSTQP